VLRRAESDGVTTVSIGVNPREPSRDNTANRPSVSAVVQLITVVRCRTARTAKPGKIEATTGPIEPATLISYDDIP
jgi:hypothetical protein